MESTGVYNPKRLRESRNGLLGIYIGKLSELRETGRVPMGFERYARMFEAAIPYFSEEDQPQYRQMVSDGFLQVQHIRAKQTIDATGHDEQERLDRISSFLSTVQ